MAVSESARGRADSNADNSDRENVRYNPDSKLSFSWVTRLLEMHLNANKDLANCTSSGRTHSKMRMTLQRSKWHKLYLLREPDP
jgi:hypothetical protein